MLFTYEIKKEYEADVFVAGGGPAGIAAAVTSARRGKKVYLAESSGTLGGMGTLGMVPEIMNFDDGENFLAGGIGKEIAERLFGNIEPYERHWHIVDTEKLKLIYDNLVTDAGVDFEFFTTLVAVIQNGGRVEKAILFSCGELFAVKAKVFIDCTGNGDLCVMAGADSELGGTDGITMPATLCSLWADINFDKTPQRNDIMLERAIADGVIPSGDKVLPGIKRISGSVGGGNVGHCFNVNPTDAKSLTHAMLNARKDLRAYETYYKKYLTGYENMFLCATANTLGVRESRRIVCENTLKSVHYDTCAVFDDEIGRYSYPRDIHNESASEDAVEKFRERINACHGKGQSYGIPYGALTPRKLENVLTAGKCIGADREMQASVRVIPGCYITGQAAGMAAAIACDCGGHVKDIDIEKLQHALIKIGAFLPNFKQ